MQTQERFPQTNIEPAVLAGTVATASAVRTEPTPGYSQESRRNEPSSYPELFNEWHQNQLAIDESLVDGRKISSRQKFDLIVRNNQIQTKFIGLYLSKDTPRERDLITRALYAGLPSDDLKDSFANKGFINGMVAEVFVFEQLKKIKGCDVRLSTTDEDVRDGFDIVLDLPSGKSIYVDAKSRVPASSTRTGKYDYNFGVKDKTTRDGSTVFVICPNPIAYEGTRFLSEIRFPDGNRVASFQEQENRRDSNQLFEVFVAQYRRYTRQTEENQSTNT